MIQLISRNKFYFLVSSGDWEAIVRSESHEDASVKGIKKAFRKFKNKINLSTIVTVTKVEDFAGELSDKNTILFSTPSVAFDAGEPSVAKKMQETINSVESSLPDF